MIPQTTNSNDRAHFLALAAVAMRHIVTDRTRARRTSEVLAA
jgi:hypothetical protein